MYTTTRGRLGRLVAAAIAAAVLLFVASPGARAATPVEKLVASPALEAISGDLAAIAGHPDAARFAATARATSVGGVLRFDAPEVAPDLVARVNQLAASSAFADAVAELDAADLQITANHGNPGDHLNRAIGNLNDAVDRVGAAVGVWTVLAIPGILACPIGSAASCVPFWILVGVGLSSVALTAAAFEVVDAAVEVANIVLDLV
jgi:hypothetical protein